MNTHRTVFPQVGFIPVHGAQGRKGYALVTQLPQSNAHLFYSKEGRVTDDLNKAFLIWSQNTALDLVWEFRHAVNGEFDKQSKLVLISYGHYYCRNADSFYVSNKVEEAVQFDTPQQALDAAETFHRLMSDNMKMQVPVELGGIRIVAIKEVLSGKVVELPSKQAPLDQAGAAPDVQYVIRFVDPEQENDLEGEELNGCWMRYYCEGTLIQSMEAAEWFERPEDAIAVANQILTAGTTEQLYNASDAVLLKLKLLGIMGQTPSINGVQITFRNKVLLQVLAVTENETEGYDWSTYFQDNLRWVFDEEVMPDEDN